MKYIYASGACLALALASGCASITTGQNQVVSVDTPNCPAATCELTNKDGVYHVAATPGTAFVNRACGKLTLTCRKEGYEDQSIQVSSSIKAMAWGNIIFGGIIGAAVDGVTGAACDYPSVIPVPMSCGEDSGATETAAAPVALTEDARKAAEAFECSDLKHVGEGQNGDTVYSGFCGGTSSLMTCSSKGCAVSSYGTEIEGD